MASENLNDEQWLAALREKAGIPEGSPMAVCYEGYEEWVKSLPKCLSYEGGCDGDLVGLEHERNCPMYGKKFATLRDAFEAGRAPLTVDRQRTLDGLKTEGKIPVEVEL